jgi:hypothetical protein
VPWLLVAAVILFLAEVFERRTGWVSRLFTRQKTAAAAVETEGAPGPAILEPEPATKRLVRKRKQKDATRPFPAPATVREQTKTETRPITAAPDAPPSTDSNLDALRKARERADRRTKRDASDK